jgi:hypothetical protein
MPTNMAQPTILPQYQGSYYDLQNRQALAQALMGQAVQNQASQIPTNMPVMPKYSIGAGLTQLGQAYLAAKLQQSVAQGYGDLGQQQMAALVGTPTQTTGNQTPNDVASGAGSGGAGATPASADQMVASSVANGGQVSQPSTQYQGGLLSPGSPLNPSGMDPSRAAWLYYNLGPEKYSEQYVAPYVKPTDTTLAARQAGFTPQEIQQANAGRIFKDNFVAPITGTGTFRDPRTMQPVAFNPNVPDGTNPLFDASGNVVAVKPIDGAQAAMQGNAAATAAGGAQFKPIQKYNPDTHQMEWTNEGAVTNPSGGAAPTLSQIFSAQESNNGKTAPDNPLQIQQGTFNQYKQGGESWANPADRTTVANRVLAGYQQKYGGDLGRIATAYFSGEGNVAPAGSATPFIKNVADSNGKTVASYVGDIYSRASSGGSNVAAAAPPLGTQAAADTGATGQQADLAKKWTDLSAQNQQAQSVISNLQNIKTLAGKATVGPQSDRLNYVNGLLSLAGSEKATDAVSANDLLNKYSNQITARLSAGGMGTDAARSILQSAYPNSHMTPQAINDAADNLQGAQQMVQAKARLLAPYRNKNDATGYNNTELTFDQNADPRIFQYANIKDATARKAFAQNLMQQDPNIVQKIQTLQGLGVLK